MEIISNKYNDLCQTSSDINEHLPTLYEYAKKCNSIFEMGIRGCVSSYALVYGLLNNNQEGKKNILLNDIVECDINDLLSSCNGLDININYIWKNNLELDITENYDLVFIDTWHVYAQLKRELDKFSKNTNKYIIMHDTTIDGEFGESARYGYGYQQEQRIQQYIIDTGFPREEICSGLMKAIFEFLSQNNNWKIKEIFTNNNGLTILEKI